MWILLNLPLFVTVPWGALVCFPPVTLSRLPFLRCVSETVLHRGQGHSDPSQSRNCEQKCLHRGHLTKHA